MGERDLLSTMADSFLGNKPVGKDFPCIRFSQDQEPLSLEKIFEDETYRDWLVFNAQVSDWSISKVAKDLPGKVKRQERVTSYLSSPSCYLPEDLEYQNILRTICETVEKDLERNNGGKFRSIISFAKYQILGQIMGNEDLREGIRNVYDLEERIVEATILYMAFEYVRLLDRTTEMRKDKRYWN